MKREIVFDMPNTTEYRVVCRFGFNSIINFAWWGHLQKKVYYKKWLFFGEKQWRWYEIDNCWFSKEKNNIEELKKSAIDFYDKKVLLKQRIIKRAMEL